MTDKNNKRGFAKKSWLGKQTWRIEVAWAFFGTIRNLAQFILWGIMTVALTGWLQLEWTFAPLLFVAGITFLWVVGAIGDKTGYWLEQESRRVKMIGTEVMVHQYTLAAAITADIIGDMFDVDTTKAKAAVQKELAYFEKITRVDIGKKDNKTPV
jgi:hypothetical protein